MSQDTDRFVDSIPFLSFQQNRILKEHAADMFLWQGIQFQELWGSCENTKNEVRKNYNRVIKIIENFRSRPIDYSDFNPSFDFKGKGATIVPDFKAPETIMGRCPCPSEDPVLRCCNLKTLDAVQQCAFACAYCSIQSFYSKNEIRVVSDLEEKLNSLILDKDVWHIGTGQSSDSLLLGDDYNTISALCSFASSNPTVVIELKTKCGRTDWIKDSIPKNIISTWSLNAETICNKEEHLAASQNARISAAIKCSEAGHLVGFHIHPMVYFEGWQNEYKALVEKLTSSVNPDMVVMVGMGSLTFTKQNLRTLRESGRPTRVTQIPLTPIAGKYSYSNEIKKEMFSYVYSLFPQEWKDKVFFYLCMEDKALWKPCLGREYQSNADFEQDMKTRYLAKIKSISMV